jgi:methylmalonyl-CoA mutase N-terminal domain/subunit
MALCSYDEAYTIPTEYSARISLRTMQLLVEEMGLTETVDPLAGSFYVETMTNEMRKKMEEIMAEVDAQGGIVKMVSEGSIQSKVSAQAYGMLRKIESGEFPKVGVNCYRNEQEDDHPVEFHAYNEQDAQVQIDALNRIRAERDNTVVDAALSRLRADAAASRNVMPALVEAVKAYASVGEMTKELVNVFGRYQEPIRF